MTKFDERLTELKSHFTFTAYNESSGNAERRVVVNEWLVNHSMFEVAGLIEGLLLDIRDLETRLSYLPKPGEFKKEEDLES